MRLFEVKPEIPEGVHLEPDEEVMLFADLPSIYRALASQAISLAEMFPEDRVIPFIKFPIVFKGSEK